MPTEHVPDERSSALPRKTGSSLKMSLFLRITSYVIAIGGLALFFALLMEARPESTFRGTNSTLLLYGFAALVAALVCAAAGRTVADKLSNKESEEEVELRQDQVSGSETGPKKQPDEEE